MFAWCRLSSSPARGQKQTKYDWRSPETSQGPLADTNRYIRGRTRQTETTEPQRQGQRGWERMSCVAGIQPWLFHIAMRTGGGDGLLSGLCHLLHLHTICVCVCWRGPMCVCVCVCVCELIIKKTPDRHTPGVCARTETDVVIYDKMPVKRRQSKCRNKERGPPRRNGMRNCLTETG